MNEKIISCYNNFQIADFDDDMVGICKAIVDFIKTLRNEIRGEDFEKQDPLNNYHKLDPHLPRLDLRWNIRSGLSVTVKAEVDLEYDIKVRNLYVILLSILYFYHISVDKVIEASLKNEEFTREDSKKLLLSDNMSPNWLKEPSGKDFSGVML